jgi:hypothetical protein
MLSMILRSVFVSVVVDTTLDAEDEEEEDGSAVGELEEDFEWEQQAARALFQSVPRGEELLRGVEQSMLPFALISPILQPMQQFFNKNVQ